MIELRWRKVFIPLVGEQVGRIDKVLQYRFKAPLHTTSIREYPPEAWQWSEWRDVPEVDISLAAERKE